MVKGPDHVKIKTVCNVCGGNWTSKEFMNDSLMVSEMKKRHPNGPTPAGD